MLAVRVASRRAGDLEAKDDARPLKNSAANEDSIVELQAEVAFFVRAGLLDYRNGLLCRIGPLLYATCSIAYWRGYSITMDAAVITAVALAVVLMLWTTAAKTASTSGMKLLLKHLDMPHAKREPVGPIGGALSLDTLIDLEFAGGKCGSGEGTGQGLEGGSSVEETEEMHGVATSRAVVKGFRDIFYQSCFVNFVLLAIWCSQASMQYETGSVGQILCLVAIPVGAITYPAVLAQLALGSAVLEMTSNLVSADVDSLRDAVVASLLDKGLGPSQQLARIDGALVATRRRMNVLNKTWGRSGGCFLVAMLLLEAVYLLVAFGAPGSVAWYGRACLMLLSLYPACALVIVLKFMGRPADLWNRHFSRELSTAKIAFEAQRLFRDGGAFRGILKDERLGFAIGGVVVSTRFVLGAAATASLGLIFCIIEIQAESS